MNITEKVIKYDLSERLQACLKMEMLCAEIYHTLVTLFPGTLCFVLNEARGGVFISMKNQLYNLYWGYLRIYIRKESAYESKYFIGCR